MDEAIYERIKATILRMRKLPNLALYDEAATKQAIILPVLQELGWETYNIDEVMPEYSIQSRRVDYALFINGMVKFFLEVKKPGEDLERHQEQLLNYAFREGVSLAALTNGITWLFFMPLKEGSWEVRRFYAIDIKEQDPSDIADKFIEILGKENVQSGQALSSAEAIYQSAVRKKTLRVKLPEAWNKMISERPPVFMETLADMTEKISGYRPTNEDVHAFMDSIEQGVCVTWGREAIRPSPTSPEKGHPAPGVPSSSDLPAGETAVHLVVSPGDALKELHSLNNKKYLKGLNEHWHQDENRRVIAQSVCWLFCWAKSGMSSDNAASESRRIFDTILDVKFSEFDKKVDHEWARAARYRKEDIETQLVDLLK